MIVLNRPRASLRLASLINRLIKQPSDLLANISLSIGLVQEIHARIKPAVVDNRIARVSSREKHGNRWAEAYNLIGQLLSVQTTAENDVREEHIDLRVALGHTDCFRTRFGRKHAISKVFKGFHGIFTNAVVIFNQQHGLAVNRARNGLQRDVLTFWRGENLRLLNMPRQIDLYSGAMSQLAVNPHMPLRLDHEAVHH